ncbi:MAG: HlyD family secretion protein [Bacteroidetes bacterium]|nr:HlyD family secretion protein [Bacteroidota bacterium]
MKRKRYFFIIAGIAALAIVAYFIFSKPQRTQQIFAKVKKGNFPIEVTTTGELLAKSSEKIGAPAALRQLWIYQIKIQDIRPEGTHVDSGDYVATLDRTEISNRMKDEETNATKFETELTRAKLDTALQLQKARDNLVTLKYALEERQIAMDQSKYETPATQRQVAIDLEKSQRTYEQEVKNYQLVRKMNVATVEAAKANYVQAKNRLERMQDVLKQLTITAPKSGMLIYKRDYNGQKIGVNSTVNLWDNVVAELPDLSKMNSRTYINEIDISKIRKGQSVKVSIDAFPDKKFTGFVAEVANIGQQQPNSNAKVFEVLIRINETDTIILRPGMTTKNTIGTAMINNVFSIPIEAVFGNDSISFVYKKDGGSFSKQQVVVGQTNENEIIIKEGLIEGEEVTLLEPEQNDKMKLHTLSPNILAKYKTHPDEEQGKERVNTSSGQESPKNTKQKINK